MILFLSLMLLAVSVFGWLADRYQNARLDDLHSRLRVAEEDIRKLKGIGR